MKLNSKLQRIRTRAVRILCLFPLLFPGAIATAQTVRPIISEYTGTGKGRVELVNDSTIPLTVIVSPKSFEVSETGEISYGPMADDIHVKLSAMSFRIQPKQSYYVFYEAKSERLPCWFVIYFEFSGFPVKDHSGLNVQLELPHTVYLLPKGSVKRDELEASAVFDGNTKKIKVTTFNKGTTVARVLMMNAEQRGHKDQGFGFPIYPQKHRIAEMQWSGSTPPEKIILEFENFKLETPVR
jgi:hypothetical protein